MSQAQKQAAKLRADAALVLHAILEQGQSSRHCLSERQHAYAQSRDKAWLQQMVFGCLRHLPTLQFWIRSLLQKPLKGNKKVVEHLLMVGLYQLAFSRVSPHAAISETVNAVKLLRADSLRGLVNAVLRQFQRDKMHQTLPDNPAALAGMSNWIYQAIAEHYPADKDLILDASNRPAPLWLRVNQMQISRTDFAAALAAEKISVELSINHPQAVIVQGVGDITQLPGYDNGWFAVQDGAAQLAAHYLAPQAQERILDCCAAPGGKTSHLLEIAPTIDCVALDNDAQRLKRVEDNLNRLKHSATLLCADAALTDDWWDGIAFDRILLDAPCSATGVIRRHPDIRWLRKRTDIDTLVNVQATILRALWRCLKPGGTLLYATCSILPSENTQQVQRFLAETADAQLDPITDSETVEFPGRQILPGEEQMDGFYYARLIKSEALSKQ
ncbi:16S rRNA (cytosine(967)-C(5))-methyltransferase RsmB [Alteromonas oceanisediminis]|uniref:16S rRNA (cytosine(967)-C(5))-methyltransferase RsmB n=1 Tax=Alteromonas oceanisediminis TaxID=2836180 RepID=UPI001BDA040E|nr:16S rRNA (cytosine(967)-C(5))-methyltransferase RsmB [Alteromonas oceanisediminis]MBT0586656.1 16S rRNA (cytosine(967)-C(5))-methyltransferase RsmB [Alteromonas oceanisediminis]